MFLRCNCVLVLPILEYCSLLWGSAAEGHLQLLELQVYSVDRLFPGKTFYDCSINVMLLHYVFCTRLIQTSIVVCSVSFHLLLSEFDIHKLQLQLIQ